MEPHPDLFRSTVLLKNRTKCIVNSRVLTISDVQGRRQESRERETLPGRPVTPRTSVESHVTLSRSLDCSLVRILAFMLRMPSTARLCAVIKHRILTHPSEVFVGIVPSPCRWCKNLICPSLRRCESMLRPIEAPNRLNSGSRYLACSPTSFHLMLQVVPLPDTRFPSTVNLRVFCSLFGDINFGGPSGLDKVGPSISLSFLDCLYFQLVFRSGSGLVFLLTQTCISR